MKAMSKWLEKPRLDLVIVPFDAEQSKGGAKGKFRELLRVEWDEKEKRPEAVAIGINPSTAHNGKSDTTITKLCRFLDMYGFRKLSMLNLYEDVSSTQLTGEEKIETDFNTKRQMFDEADMILVVWGYSKNKELERLKTQANQVLMDYSDKLYCIRTKSGKYPAHPSRMHYCWEIVPYAINEKRER